MFTDGTPRSGKLTSVTDSPKASPEPLRPDLWEIVRPALTSALTAGVEHLRDRQYFLRRSVPAYQESDEGWSTTVRDRPGAAHSGPPDWSRLFSLDEHDSNHIPVEEVPELHAAISKATELSHADPSFREGISELSMRFKDDHEQFDAYIAVEFLGLIGDILNRATATDSTGVPDLFRIYLEAEHARFSPTLRGDAVIPLLLISFKSTEPVAIANNAWLEPLDTETQRSRAMDWMRSDVSAYAAAAATHAFVLRDIEFANPRFQSDQFLRDRTSQFDLSLLELFLHCITIHEELSTGYAQVLVRPNGWAKSWTHDLPPLFTEWSGRMYPESLDRVRLFRPKVPISHTNTQAIIQMTRNLTKAPKNVKLAAKRSWRVTYRDEFEDQIIDCTIGIEALVGRDRDELVHRMSQRAAVALVDQYPPQNIYSLMKQVYGQRSTIVHGGSPKNTVVRLGGHEFPAHSIAAMLLRLLLRSYLLAEDPWSPDVLDARLLQGLERGGGYPTAEQ